MKLKLAIILSIVLVISLFTNLVLSLNLVELSNGKKVYEKRIDELELEIEEFAAIEEIESNFDYLNGTEAERIIELFFMTQYDYDYETYKDRFANLKTYVSDEVYGQLTSAGIPEIPNVKFSNSVEDIQIYLTEKNDHIDSMILLDSIYSVDGFDHSQMTQIFNVVFKDGVISSLELVGTFSKMSES